MLADSYQTQITQLVNNIDCRIRLPEEWAGTFFSETGVQSTSFNERRRFVRHQLRTKGILAIKQTIPAVPRPHEHHLVYTFNVARGGFSFLHAEQLYPSEVCDLWLPTHQLNVEVTRCRFINESCYLIGARPKS